MKKLLTLVLFVSLFVGTGGVAHANPLFGPQPVTTATATTTLNYMTAGTGTTSLAYDTYTTNSSGTNTLVDNLGLLLQGTASSTGTKFAVTYEYAIPTSGVNCATNQNACDWYQDNQVGISATTSQAFQIVTPNSYVWNFASTSQGGAVVQGTNNRGLKFLNVPTLARYVRAVFSLPVGSTNGAIWAAFVPVKQRPE